MGSEKIFICLWILKNGIQSKSVQYKRWLSKKKEYLMLLKFNLKLHDRKIIVW